MDGFDVFGGNKVNWGWGFDDVACFLPIIMKGILYIFVKGFD